MTQNIGTPHWMAPELMVRNTNYGSKVDVYAYGIVL
jgi:serine/threonine protein kinase